MRWTVAWMAAWAGCVAPSEQPMPEDFVWGTATAGFQVDMGCPDWSDAECLDTASDWYQWVTSEVVLDDPALFTTGEDVRHGPGMWQTFEDDVDRMRRAGHDGYRLSLEWSRLFPDAAAAEASTVDELAALVNPAAVARYHEMFAALAAADIEVMVTVNHYTLPLWVHDGVACYQDDDCAASGWLDPAIVERIALYAGFCGREFGGEVDRWATENEPFANTLAGYVQPGELRVHPPGRTFDGAGAVASVVHQIEAHAAMYDQLHAEDREDADGDGVSADVGIALNLVAVAPRDPDSDADVQAAAHLDYLYHRIFLDALTVGNWDDDVDGTVDRVRPELADRLDWIGVNYYNQVLAGSLGSLRPIPEIPALDFLPTVIEEPYPQGMAEVVALAAEYDRPIYITENGTMFEDLRREALDDTLVSLHEAIDTGADVRGYFYWSYIDNYEWNHGMAQAFGLQGFDAATKERQPRPLWDRFAEIARRNGP